jgi:phage shock protein A
MANREAEDARSSLPELRRMLAASMADEQRLYQRYTEEGLEADRWRARAELAVSRGDDELARAALERAGLHGARSREHHAQYLDQKAYVEDMKARLLGLEIRARSPLPASVPVDFGKVERTLARLHRQEERAAEERARLAALAELERDEVAEKLAALEREDRLERQLAELKAKLGVAS